MQNCTAFTMQTGGESNTEWQSLIQNGRVWTFWICNTYPPSPHTHTHETGSSLSCRACNAYWQSLQCIMAESTVHSVRVCSADRQSRKSRVADSMVQSARVYNAKPTHFGLAVSTPLIFSENPEVLAPVCNAEWQSL